MLPEPASGGVLPSCYRGPQKVQERGLRLVKHRIHLGHAHLCPAPRAPGVGVGVGVGEGRGEGTLFAKNRQQRA